MSDRFAAGFTIAGFPLTAALLAVTAGNYCLAAPLVLAFVVVLLLTVAPRLPLLHRLPGVGAPRLAAKFTANGFPDLRVVGLPDPLDPVSVLVRVQVYNPARVDVEHAMLNFAFPYGHGLRACDSWGEPDHRGMKMPPTQETPSFDYWAMDDLRFSGRNTRLFNFRVRLKDPGAYTIKLRIQSKDLFEEFIASEDLHMERSSPLSLRDQLGALIDKGERLRGQVPDVFSGDALRVETAALILAATILLGNSDHPELRDRLDTDLDYSGEETGDDYYRVLIAARVQALYEVRDYLAVLEP